MPLARKITKSVYDAFTGNDAYKKNIYIQGASADEYVLDTDDGGADAALRAKQHEADEHAKTKRQLEAITTERDTEKAAKEALEAEKRAGFKKDPDRDAIENDLRGKLTAAETAKTEAIKASDKKLSEYIITNEAEKLAETISTVPTMMAREVRERLTVDLSGDKPVVRVLDKDGKPSATSLQELSKEFVDNPAFKTVIKASNASGSGAGPGNNGGSASNKPFKDMSEGERTALFRSNPTEFQRLSSEHQAASVPAN